MLRYLLYAFLSYMLLRFVFELVIPLFRTTRRLRRDLREAREQLRSRAAAHAPAQPKAGSGGGAKPSDDEYIDFEEVRD